MTANDQDSSRAHRGSRATPGEGSSRAARSEDRRAEIIRAALEVIAERGYRGTSMAAVAERVGLTQQGLLHYFPAKEALLIAALQLRDQWDTASAARHGTAWPMETLADLVEYNTTRPGVVQVFAVLAGDSVTEDHPARAFFKDRYRTTRQWIADSLRAEYGDELACGLTPAQAAPLLIAVMDGLQMQWLHEPEAVDMAEAFRAFVALLEPPE